MYYKKFLLIFIFLLLILIVGIFSPSFSFAEDLLPPEPSEFKLDTSRNLTLWAWQNYNINKKNYDRAIKWAEICVFFWEVDAKAQSQDLIDYPQGSVETVYSNYWALNDVGTCWLIIGESYRHKGDEVEAEKAYKMLIDENKSRGPFYFAQCAPEPGSTYKDLWKPADVAYVRLMGCEVEPVDDVGLLNAAWTNLATDRNEAIKLTELCLYLFLDEIPAEWAVNAVATAYFIQGEAYRMDNRSGLAKGAYSRIVDNVLFKEAQCLDLGPDGELDAKSGGNDDTYWNVYEAAKHRKDLDSSSELYPTPLFIKQK